MKPTTTLHDLGQSLWLDNVTRALLSSGTLQRYIAELSVTGLTSNPTIFDHAIKNSADYDADIAGKAPSAEVARGVVLRAGAGGPDAGRGHVPPDLRADRRGRRLGVARGLASAGPRHRATRWTAARNLHQRGGKPNLFIKIPGTKEGLPAIEAAIFAGIPINVTLLFSREQYLAAADAYLRGVERRIEAGLNPAVASVASLFVSRWDVAVSGKVPGELTNRLGIAVAQRAYKAYCELLASPRFQRAANSGARAQRFLWASTGTKDPKAARHALCGRARGALHRQHDARGHPQGRLPTTARPERRSPRTEATARPSWPASPRPASTSTPWPRASRTRAPRRSSSPGTI